MAFFTYIIILHSCLRPGKIVKKRVKKRVKKKVKIMSRFSQLTSVFEMMIIVRCVVNISYVHPTVEDAVETPVNHHPKIDEMEPDELKALAACQSVWIDEWIRRSNGDRYQILPIIPNKINNLKRIVDVADIGKKCSEKIKYVLVNIDFDKEADCIDDIDIYVSFHENAENALDVARSDNLSDRLLTVLETMKPVLRKRSKKRGAFYQICLEEIKKESGLYLKTGDKICLNKMCKHLRQDLWYEDISGTDSSSGDDDEE